MGSGRICLSYPVLTFNFLMNVNGPIDHLGTPSLKIKDCFLGNKAISSGSIVWGGG
ncbi:hypothetical protein ETSB_0688 [cyanobacterium endosymbiont of Epithemia turgida isolate EtSB Lake Yunoko]|nr:hypothetical protein ETSB_0688 [cyanobacterium endosymbiont of Epithemia turgida isolate EtSB Lake Yunoko]